MFQLYLHQSYLYKGALQAAPVPLFNRNKGEDMLAAYTFLLGVAVIADVADLETIRIGSVSSQLKIGVSLPCCLYL